MAKVRAINPEGVDWEWAGKIDTVDDQLGAVVATLEMITAAANQDFPAIKNCAADFFFQIGKRVEGLRARLPSRWAADPDMVDQTADELSSIGALLRFIFHLAPDTIEKGADPAVAGFFNVVLDIANQIEKAEKELLSSVKN
jgi:hypothetical protein